MKGRLALLAALTTGFTLILGSYTQSNQGAPIRWPSSARIKVVMNSTLAPGNSPDLVQSSLQSVLGAWNSAMTGNGIGVQFVDGGLTSYNVAGCDGVNLITFTYSDPQNPFSPGELARAGTWTVNSVGPFRGCGPEIDVQFLGQIIDADLTFNTSLLFSTVGLANTNDIEPVALHEAGHMLGLNHSGIPSAIMAPAGDSGGFSPRILTADEIAGLNFVYQVNVPGGAISGRVNNASGAGVFGAHVVATDNSTGMTTAGTLSNQDGTYRIVGIPKGTYRVFVEPLDSPVSLDFDGFPQPFQVNGAKAASNDFSTVFLSSPVTVQGEASGVNITVGAKTMNPQNLTVVGPDGSGLGGFLPLSAQRGVKGYQIVVGGTGLSGDITLSAPAGKITAAGATTATGDGRLSRKFDIAADAPLGAMDIYVPAGALTGMLLVVPNLAVSAITEAADFNRTSGTKYAPGSIIAIFGTDLAGTTASAPKVPLSTQLGGVSVKIGDRLAPLYYVSPGQINAMIPFEVSGSVPVQVIGGNNSTSATTTIQVGTSAPRIFAGAIIDFQGNSPAVAGDTLIIYCGGLGVTSPALASGLGSPAYQITAPLRVTIGGRDAAVAYKGLTPTLVGLYQVNVTVPAGVSGNVGVQIINANNEASNTVTIAVK